MKKWLYFLSLLGLVWFIYSPNKNSIKIPVVFNIRPYRPFVNPQIEGKKYRFLVDLGTHKPLNMSKALLEQLSKVKQDAVAQTLDFKGNRYISAIYQIPKFKIGSFVQYQCDITEEDNSFHQNTGLWIPINTSTPPDGRIGWHFFNNRCVLFDFSKSSIIIGNSLEDLIKDKRLNLNHFHKVPIIMKNGLLATKIETDFGPFEAIFDTGSNFAVLRRSKIQPESILHTCEGRPYVSSNTVLINGYDFKSWNFAVTDFSDLLEIDSILGTDFFLKHAICFDFPNQTAYIQKPRSSLSFLWQMSKFHVTQFFFRNFEKWGLL